MVFSIIVPVFNRRKYIRRCLDSIMKQSFQDFELIIVDDGSDDGTAKICDEYGQKYTNIRVHHQINGGVSKARNAGLKMAIGKYVLFVDSDDYLPINYLLHLFSAYEKYGTKFCYFTSFKVHTVNGVKYYQYRKGMGHSVVKKNDFIRLMDKGLFNSVVNKTYEMSIIKKYKIQFPEHIDLGEDLIFNLRYLDKNWEVEFFILNSDFYIVWAKNEKESLERGWHDNFLEMQVILLEEKIKYLEKWLEEGKIFLKRNDKNIFGRWHYICIYECVEYYVSHIKDICVVQLIGKLIKLMRSSVYSRYIQIYRGNRWVVLQILHKIWGYRLKENLSKS